MSSIESSLNNTGRAEMVDDEIDLGEYIAALVDAKWLIAAITAIAFAIGVTYALLATPIYRGDALLQVEDKTGGTGLGELSPLFVEDTPAETEIEIIRSRSVIGAAIDQLARDIMVKPIYFPLIGRTIAARHKKGDPVQPRWGLDGYAWGGERIQVQRLILPRVYEERGEPLVLIAGEAGRYELVGPDGEVLLKGQVGQAAKSQGAPDESAEIFVPELRAAPGARFELRKRSRTQAITTLQRQLQVSQKGNKTNVLQLALEGPDPKLVSATLDAIANAYLRQNVERRSAEAEKTLEFLNKQLPELKANLEADETRLNAYRSRMGSIDISLETQAVIEKSAEVERALSELELKKTELRARFTESHPALVTLQQKRDRLGAQREALDRQIRSMPDEVQESVRLMRDVTVSNELYLLLLNKAQEMNVVKAGTVGNVRILDTAFVPGAPVKPKKAMIAVLSLVLGFVLGIITALVRKSLNRGMEDPDLMERQFGIPVYASIPHSEKQETLVVQGKKKSERYTKLLGSEDPKDLAIESLRSLRTSMQFALLGAKNNVVAILGPGPGIGKSFVSANLAYVVADSGKKTLLIDGDMRKGRLHEYFDMQRGNGLSGVISGDVSLDAVIRDTSVPSLNFLPAGIVPPNPSELLMTERFKSTIEALAKQYDLVIIDTPPVLAVTDAAIIGRLAGTHFITMKSGLHPAREIEQTLKRLNQNGIKPQGFIFNDVPHHARGYGYGQYGKYGYHYQYEYK